MNKIIIIKDKSSPWHIVKKNEDMSCSVKHINSETILKGEILSISSYGKYTIGVKDGKNKRKEKGEQRRT